MKHILSEDYYIVHVLMHHSGINGIGEAYVHKTNIVSSKRCSFWTYRGIAKKIGRIMSLCSFSKVFIFIFVYISYDVFFTNYEKLRMEIVSCNNQRFFLPVSVLKVFSFCEDDKLSFKKVS